jgi:hypothetical protein
LRNTPKQACRRGKTPAGAAEALNQACGQL